MTKRFIGLTVLGIMLWVIIGYQRLHASYQREVASSSYAQKPACERQWIPQSAIQSPSAVSFMFNIGCGFLYFHKIQGNLTPAPKGLFGTFSGATFDDIQRFSYNKTPMFEANIAARFLPWLSGALTYYGQSGVSVQSHANSAIAIGNSNAPVWALFQSNLQLYGVLFKCYAQSPYALRIGDWAMTPYLGMGVGPSWQTWSAPTVYEMAISSNTYTSTVLSLRQKVSANACWTGELGLTFKPAYPDAGLSLRVGCKYIDWGGSGNIGVLQQQETKVAPFKPISVKKVYSFVPFIGVQFNF